MSKNKKTILITGAGQGIGQAIAFRFAPDGNNLVIASKDTPNIPYLSRHMNKVHKYHSSLCFP